MSVIAGPQKQPREVVRLRVSYVPWLQGATLVGVTVDVTPVTDPLMTVTTMFDSAERELSMFFAGGLDGTDYTANVKANISDGQVREDEVRVRVRELV